jgi:hypothetical protein
VSTETIEKFPHSLRRVQPDFLYSVPREFISNCRTPILVQPDDTPSHPLPTSIDVASLAPNIEITVFPWREPPELKARTVNRVRTVPQIAHSDAQRGAVAGASFEDYIGADVNYLTVRHVEKPCPNYDTKSCILSSAPVSAA